MLYLRERRVLLSRIKIKYADGTNVSLSFGIYVNPTKKPSFDKAQGDFVWCVHIGCTRSLRFFAQGEALVGEEACGYEAKVAYPRGQGPFTQNYLPAEYNSWKMHNRDNRENNDCH